MSSMKPVNPAQARPLHQNQWMRRVDGARELLAAVAIDDTDQRRKPIEHRVDLQRTHCASTGARYRVTYLGTTLVESPGGSVTRMRVDIEKGAKLTTVENANDGPRFARYRPHPSSAREEDAE